MPRLYVCRGCHSTKQVKYTCFCCERVVNKNMCIPFNEDEYDFKKYIVYKCIGHVNICEGPHYICMNCHTSLLATNDDNLHVPYNVKKGTVKAGANFLAASKNFLNMYAHVVISQCFEKLSGHLTFLSTMSVIMLLKNVCLITLL